MKLVKLNTKTKEYIIKLLALQKKCIAVDDLTTLKKINVILFTINERWRAKMLQVNDINYTSKGYKTIIQATCYKF